MDLPSPGEASNKVLAERQKAAADAVIGGVKESWMP